MPADPPTDVAFLRAAPLFAGLPNDHLAALSGRLHTRTLPAHSVVFHQGQAGDALYVIIHGKVRVFLTGANGQELTVDILSAGEVFGEMALLGDHPRSASVLTLTTTQVLTLDQADFHQLLLAYPEMAVHILSTLADRLRSTTAFAAELVFNDLHGRVARVLLTLAERHGLRDGTAVALDLDLTQGALAQLVGSTRESVNRVLGIYRDRGLVAVNGPRITLLQPAALARITSPGGPPPQV